MNNLSGIIGPSPADSRDYPASVILKKVTLPDEVRLDDRALEVLNQGFFPTCVGKAGKGIMSAYLRKSVSALYLYARCKQLDGIPNEPGTYARTAMNVLVKNGVCLEATLPYSTLKDWRRLPPLTETMHKEAEKYRASAYARAWNLNDIKMALAAGRLVMVVTLVDDAFMYYQGGSVLGPPTGNLHGYHATWLCGYSNSRRAIRGLNSYDKTWGEGGFYWWSYDAPVVEAWILDHTVKEQYMDRIFRLLKKN
jgi:hypothetical protein